MVFTSHRSQRTSGCVIAFAPASRSACGTWNFETMPKIAGRVPFGGKACVRIAAPRVTSTAENCLGSACADFEECFVVKARRNAQAADVLEVGPDRTLFADHERGAEAGLADLLVEIRPVEIRPRRRNEGRFDRRKRRGDFRRVRLLSTFTEESREPREPEVR